MNTHVIPYLLVERSAPIDAGRFMDTLFRLFPDWRGKVDPPDPQTWDGETGTLLIDRMIMGFVQLPAPFPVGDLKMSLDAARTLAAAFGNNPTIFDSVLGPGRGWPDAGRDLQRMGGHIIVTPMNLRGNESFETVRSTAVAAARFTAALAEVTPSIGVYWSNGDTLSRAATFVRVTQGLTDYKYPSLEWVQLFWVRGEPTPEGRETFGLQTHGLKSFIGREVLILPTLLMPPYILAIIDGVINYLLTRGMVFGDGDTMSVTGQDMLRIRHGLGGGDPAHPVLEVTIETLDDKPVSPTADQYRNGGTVYRLRVAPPNETPPPTVTAPAPVPAPVQSAAAPSAPPPPPASGAGTPRDPAGYDVKQAEFLVRAMARSAKTDDRISDNERAKLDAWFAATPLAAIDHLFLDNELSRKRPVDEIVHRLPPDLVEDVYAVSVLVIGRPGFGERRYLNELAKALNLDPGRAKQLETEYAD